VLSRALFLSKARRTPSVTCSCQGLEQLNNGEGLVSLVHALPLSPCSQSGGCIRSCAAAAHAGTATRE